MIVAHIWNLNRMNLVNFRLYQSFAKNGREKLVHVI